MSWNDFAVARRLFARGPARAGPRAPQDVEEYVRAIRRPRALASMIHYYRAAARQRPRHLARLVRPVAVPTLVVWGDRDAYLVPELTEGLGPWVTDLRVVRLPDATHWVQHDRPERVNELLLDFLKPGVTARCRSFGGLRSGAIRLPSGRTCHKPANEKRPKGQAVQGRRRACRR